MIFFQLYNLPVSLAVDATTLKQKFYQLSRQYHPDFFANATEEEQAEVLEKSSQVNKAFKIFSNREETIKYVLQQKGLLIEEEKFALPPAFLMDMMELNEQMMDAKMEQSSTATHTLKLAIQAKQTEAYETIKHIVEHYKEGVTTEKELLQVKEYYYKQKYLYRILEGFN
jgi:molecular chaperone HscB